MKHKALVKSVIEAVNLSKLARVWKMQSGLFRTWTPPYKPAGQIGMPGVPDICGMTYRGKFIGIEIKVGKDKQRESQQDFENYCNYANALYILFRDTDNLTQLIETIRSKA